MQNIVAQTSPKKIGFCPIATTYYSGFEEYPSKVPKINQAGNIIELKKELPMKKQRSTPTHFDLMNLKYRIYACKQPTHLIFLRAISFTVPKNA